MVTINLCEFLFISVPATQTGQSKIVEDLGKDIPLIYYNFITDDIQIFRFCIAMKV